MVASRSFYHDRFEDLSLKVFDHFQRMKPRAYQDAPVRFLDIDDQSLRKLGQWPWPRNQMADLVDRLSNAGAAAIVMDILFAEPDRTSPGHILSLWEKEVSEESRKRFAADFAFDHDEVFAASIAKAGNVVTGFTLTHDPNTEPPAVKTGFARSGDDPLNYLPVFKGVITNLSGIEKAAKGNGCFNFIAEEDGILRRIPMIFRYKTQLVPSLVAESLRVAQGASSIIIKTSTGSGEKSFSDATGIASLKIGAAVLPTDAEGRLWLYDTGYVPGRSLPAWKVFEKDFDPALVQDKIILIGSSAAGLKDLRATPLNPVTAGTEVHVQLLEQALTQDFLNRPDWAEGAEILLLVFTGTILILILPFIGALWSAVFGLCISAAAYWFSWYLFQHYHRLLDPVTPVVASLLIYITVSLMHYLRTETEKRHIRGAFSRYVSPALLEKISKNPGQLKLGGETRNMSILFSDIRNFTTRSEQYSAQELTHFMNRYLTPMTDLILGHNGTIDKYIGDCIMAFWNAPIDVPEHPRHACLAALHMLEHLKRWNSEMDAEAIQLKHQFTPVAIGIGINSGNCCVGNMGSNQRFDYSVLGDEVNLASRLEGQSKVYGVSIVAGQNTYDQTKEFAYLELDSIKVKGKTKPVQIYALLGDEKMKRSELFQNVFSRHRKMLEAYRAGDWKTALKEIEGLLALNAYNLEGLYRFYSERIAEQQQGKGL